MATVDKKLTKSTVTVDGKKADEKLDQHDKCVPVILIFANVFTSHTDMNLADRGVWSPS